MAEDIPVINLFLDYTKPGGVDPLLDGFKSKPAYSRPALMAGDACKLRLYFRTRNSNAESDSTAETIPSGSTIVVAAKKASDLSSSILFVCSSFVATTGLSSAACYDGTLDLNTAEIVSAMAALTGSTSKMAILVDIEVRNAGNTARVTYQTTLDLYRQVYAGETAPGIVALPPAILTAPDGGIWQLGVTNDGQPQFTKVA